MSTLPTRGLAGCIDAQIWNPSCSSWRKLRICQPDRHPRFRSRTAVSRTGFWVKECVFDAGRSPVPAALPGQQVPGRSRRAGSKPAHLLRGPHPPLQAPPRAGAQERPGRAGPFSRHQPRHLLRQRRHLSGAALRPRCLPPGRGRDLAPGPDRPLDRQELRAADPLLGHQGAAEGHPRIRAEVEDDSVSMDIAFTVNLEDRAL